MRALTCACLLLAACGPAAPVEPEPVVAVSRIEPPAWVSLVVRNETTGQTFVAEVDGQRAVGPQDLAGGEEARSLLSWFAGRLHLDLEVRSLRVTNRLVQDVDAPDGGTVVATYRYDEARAELGWTVEVLP